MLAQMVNNHILSARSILKALDLIFPMTAQC